MRRLRVVAYPRDANPYQESLHAALAELGVAAGYLPARTRSAALNLALLPVEVLLARRRGADVLHVHWLYLFDHPAARAGRWVRRALRSWLGIVLATARVVGLPVVWTAHNELPHRPIFDDDAAARAALGRSAAAVLAHSDDAARRLVDRGWVAPHRVAVIPHGPLPLPPPSTGRAATRAGLGVAEDARLLAFVGRVEAYKGVEGLLSAVAEESAAGRWPPGVVVLVAGGCRDPRLADRLRALADAAGATVVLRLEYVPDARLADLLAAADVVVLPFDAVTTSGSALLALGAGRPLALPAHALPDLPREAVLRFDDVPGLGAAVAGLDDAALARLWAAAHASQRAWTWEDVAIATVRAYTAAVAGVDVAARPVAAGGRRA